MNAFGGMFAAAGYHAAVQADPYGRMAGVHAGLQDPTATAAAALMHHHHHAAAHPAAHMHGIHAHHQYKVPRIFYKIPRVLPYKDQKEKFETDDFFKKLTRESEVRFVAFRDRPIHERIAKFNHSIREGNVELSVLSNGFLYALVWDPVENSYINPNEYKATRIDFNKERGKVFLDSPLIINGLCVRWKGYINMEKLDGVGGFRFDEEFARIEDMAMQQIVECNKGMVRDLEEQGQRHRYAIQQAQQQAAAAHAVAQGQSTATGSVGSSSSAVSNTVSGGRTSTSSSAATNLGSGSSSQHQTHSHQHQQQQLHQHSHQPH